MRRLVVLVESPDHVCYRYRYAAYREGLRACGWELEPLVLKKSWALRLVQFAGLARTDAVVLQRRLLPVWQLFCLRRCVSTLLYDFDDALLYRDSYSIKAAQSWNRRRLFAATMRSVDGVIAGNRFLEQLATRWCPARRVTKIPTCVNPDLYSCADAQGTEEVELCWIGSRSTAKAFDLAGPLFEAIGRTVPGVRLRVISDWFPSFTHLPVIQCPWSQQGEAAALVASDIGVSWLPDDLWSQGKCGLKVLQYMAAGLPVVANPVGPHRELIEHEKTGFLAETADEWRAAVAMLAANPALRRHMGANGRRRVEEEYSLARWTVPLARCLDQTAGASRQPAQSAQRDFMRSHVPRWHSRTAAGRSETESSRSSRG